MSKLRFDLVPKVLTEAVFWRAYFYAVQEILEDVQTAVKNGDFPSVGSDSAVAAERGKGEQVILQTFQLAPTITTVGDNTADTTLLTSKSALINSNRGTATGTCITNV